MDCAAKYYFKDLFPIKGVGRYPLNPCASVLNNFWGQVPSNPSMSKSVSTGDGGGDRCNRFNGKIFVLYFFTFSTGQDGQHCDGSGRKHGDLATSWHCTDCGAQSQSRSS